jgi:hypothetical protein
MDARVRQRDELQGDQIERANIDWISKYVSGQADSQRTQRQVQSIIIKQATVSQLKTIAKQYTCS